MKDPCHELGVIASESSSSAFLRLRVRRRIAPRPAPGEERRITELCSRKISRTSVSPSPVPPPPCSCPRPTCANASPSFTASNSSMLSPEPVSCTSTTTCEVGESKSRTVGAGRAAFSSSSSEPSSSCVDSWRHARIVINPPDSVNLIELMTPFCTHCWSLRPSPMKTACSRSGGSASIKNVMPLAAARPTKVSAAACSSCDTRT
mmetsp:Transcript_36424/g.90857  ORF Transcript_36424/g.90857 Transcript_36424/m.90857 type:complete len:205 (+) Transcript_36424:397-1011(+)